MASTTPWGTDATGYLLYAAQGCFSVTISRRAGLGLPRDLLGGTT